MERREVGEGRFIHGRYSLLRRVKKRPFGLFLFCHSLRKKFTDSFCWHIITVVEKPFGAFDDEPIHQVLCNEVIGGRKEGKACLVMLFFRDETGKSGCFQTLLQEELVDGLPAFLLGQALRSTQMV